MMSNKKNNNAIKYQGKTIANLEWLNRDVIDKLYKIKLFSIEKFYYYLCKVGQRTLLRDYLNVPESTLKAWLQKVLSEYPDLAKARPCEIGPMAFGFKKPLSVDKPKTFNNHCHYYLNKIRNAYWNGNNIDLRPELTRVRNQAMRGFCWAFATVFAASYLLSKAFIGSVAFIVQCAKTEKDLFVTPWSDVDGDNPHHAAKIMTHYGLPSEQEYPFDPDLNMHIRPSSDIFEKARKNILGDMVELCDHNISVDSIAASLGGIDNVNARPLSFAVPLFDSFTTVGEDGFVPMPLEGEMIIGWHEMSIVGATVINFDSYSFDYFIVRNSWSENWGDYGYCYVPFEYIIDYSVSMLALLTQEEVNEFSQYEKQIAEKPPHALPIFQTAAIIVFSVLITLLTAVMIKSKTPSTLDIVPSYLAASTNMHKTAYKTPFNSPNFDAELERLIELSNSLNEEHY